MPLSALNGNFLLTQHAASHSPSIQQFCRDPLKAGGKGRLIGQRRMVWEGAHVFAVDVDLKKERK